jgi:hypothetical protein
MFKNFLSGNVQQALGGELMPIVNTLEIQAKPKILNYTVSSSLKSGRRVTQNGSSVLNHRLYSSLFSQRSHHNQMTKPSLLSKMSNSLKVLITGEQKHAVYITNESRKDLNSPAESTDSESDTSINLNQFNPEKITIIETEGSRSQLSLTFETLRLINKQKNCEDRVLSHLDKIDDIYKTLSLNVSVSFVKKEVMSELINNLKKSIKNEFFDTSIKELQFILSDTKVLLSKEDKIGLDTIYCPQLRSSVK